MTQTELWTTFERQLKDIMEGKRILPNAEQIELERAVSNATLGWDKVRPSQSCKLDGDKFGQWALYFLGTTQGGSFDGTGMVMVYGAGRGKAFNFSICKHEKVEGPGANPRRGWHPGKCKLCGLDMTVDSGD